MGAAHTDPCAAQIINQCDFKIGNFRLFGGGYKLRLCISRNTDWPLLKTSSGKFFIFRNKTLENWSGLFRASFRSKIVVESGQRHRDLSALEGDFSEINLELPFIIESGKFLKYSKNNVRIKIFFSSKWVPFFCPVLFRDVVDQSVTKIEKKNWCKIKSAKRQFLVTLPKYLIGQLLWIELSSAKTCSV